MKPTRQEMIKGIEAEITALSDMARYSADAKRSLEMRVAIRDSITSDKAAIRELVEIIAKALALKGGWREAIVELEAHCSERVLLRNMIAAADQLDAWSSYAKDIISKHKENPLNCAKAIRDELAERDQMSEHVKPQMIDDDVQIISNFIENDPCCQHSDQVCARLALQRYVAKAEALIKTLEVIADEEKFMAYASAGDPKLQNEMKVHCFRNLRAMDAVSTFRKIRYP